MRLHVTLKLDFHLTGETNKKPTCDNCCCSYFSWWSCVVVSFLSCGRLRMNKRTFSHFNEAYRHEHHSKKISKMPQNLITTDASWCEPQNLLSTLFFLSIFVWKLMHGRMRPNFNEFNWGAWILLTRRQGMIFDVFFMLFQEILECKKKQLKSLLWPICVKQQIFQKRLFLGISSRLWAF